ncbi:DNA alkylation repair protein [Pseudomonas sp. NCHU5208]|uniref:DNA alkylation repair protein n=1 Tax=unclassified Pseudomonas TaxID=196821 RepID=UPI003F95FF47
MDFKDYFDFALAEQLAQRTACVYPEFNQASFYALVPNTLPDLEMKARVRALADALWGGLGLEYPRAIEVLCKAMGPIPGSYSVGISGFPVWVVADVIERHGLEYFDESMRAIHLVTQRFTGEFAIRPFLRTRLAQTLSVLEGWTRDESDHVRRLVSEGTRPRLPWASQVPSLLADPQPVIALLAKLKGDSSEYVRRSVANSLNDISKDHPDLVVDTLRAWENEQPDSATLAWITRHGLRTLARQGHLQALELLGYSTAAVLTVPRFSVAPQAVALGSDLLLSCELHIEGGLDGLMIDYAILAPGARGQINRRVFKWSKRRSVNAGALTLERTHRLENRASRIYYPGEHQVHLIVNGQVKAVSEFEVRH